MLSFPDLWRAGWGVAIVGHGAEVVASAFGLVWRGLPQTSAAAKWCAAAAAAQLADASHYVLSTDYVNLQRMAKQAVAKSVAKFLFGL
jgi:hypothetical protein